MGRQRISRYSPQIMTHNERTAFVARLEQNPSAKVVIAKLRGITVEEVDALSTGQRANLLAELEQQAHGNASLVQAAKIQRDLDAEAENDFNLGDLTNQRITKIEEDVVEIKTSIEKIAAALVTKKEGEAA